MLKKNRIICLCCYFGFLAWSQNVLSNSESIDSLLSELCRVSFLLKPVKDMGLNRTARKSLKAENINLIGDLVSKKEEELLKLKGLGRGGINKIKAELRTGGDFELDMKLKNWPPNPEQLNKAMRELPRAEEPLPQVTEFTADLLRPITSFLDLSNRSKNTLTGNRIHRVGDLITKTEEDLLQLWHFGQNSLNDVKAALAKKGLRLGMKIKGGWPPDSKPLKPLEKQPQKEEPKSGNRTPERESQTTDERALILAFPIESLDLSLSSIRILKNHGIDFVGDLVKKTREELLKLYHHKNRLNLKEVEAALEKKQLRLNMESVHWPTALLQEQLQIIERLEKMKFSQTVDDWLENTAELLKLNDREWYILIYHIFGDPPENLQSIWEEYQISEREALNTRNRVLKRVRNLLSRYKIIQVISTELRKPIETNLFPDEEKKYLRLQTVPWKSESNDSSRHLMRLH